MLYGQTSSFQQIQRAFFDWTVAAPPNITTAGQVVTSQVLPNVSVGDIIIVQPSIQFIFQTAVGDLTLQVDDTVGATSILWGGNASGFVQSKYMRCQINDQISYVVPIWGRAVTAGAKTIRIFGSVAAGAGQAQYSAGGVLTWVLRNS